MEKKYINESRYKKNYTRKRRDSKTVKNKLNNEKTIVGNNKKIKTKAKATVKTKKRNKDSKIKNIVSCIILLLIIALVSRGILKDENEPFIPLPFFVQSNEEALKIGIITEESLLNINNKNLVINELNKYSKDMLLQINEDYSITYKSISSVSKLSNIEYILTRNIESNITVDEIKRKLDSYRSDTNSMYYTQLSNIENITIINSNEINIKLKSEDKYFVYDLEVCLGTSKDYANYVQDVSSSEKKIIYNRHKDADKELPAKVIVTKYKNIYDVVEAYKDKEINIFTTNAENVVNLLGRYEYNIKAYRNGRTTFLFGNPASKIFNIEEVRRALAYSIDRDGIIKDVLKSKGDKLDLPYIYDNIKYKYDVYAAENLLLTNGYKKQNNIYSKKENGLKTILSLDLLVNKDDDIKISIANKIKANLSAIGVKINVQKLSESKIKERTEKENYDLILANVDLSNNPDISFIHNNILITDGIKQAIDDISDLNIRDLNKNIIELQSSLSQCISAIGIYSDVSYLIYSKDIIGINEVNYLNLFSEILS